MNGQMKIKFLMENSNYTIYTMYTDTGDLQFGEISNIPANIMVCTLVLRVDLQKEINLRDELMGIKTKRNYLTIDELNFLTT